MHERSSTGRHVAVGLFCLALAALGLLLMVRTGYESSGAVVTAMLGAFLVVVALVIYLGFIVRLRSTAPAPQSVVVDGEPALHLRRAPLTAVGNCLLAGALALFFLGWAVVLGIESGWGGAVVLAIPALIFLLLPLFALTGRWVPGGLWLTPTRLVHRAYGVRAWTTWDDIGKVDAAPVGAPINQAPTSGVHTRDAHGSYTTPFFRNGKLAEAGRMILDLRDLAAAPPEVARLVST
ncbi:MAG: hypothetical protein ABIN79_05845, partial [Marmoricola sp.]